MRRLVVEALGQPAPAAGAVFEARGASARKAASTERPRLRSSGRPTGPRSSAIHAPTTGSGVDHMLS